MNSRMLAYLPSRRQQSRRLKPVARTVSVNRSHGPVMRQSDWDAFLRLTIVVVLTGCAIAVLHWVSR